MTILVTGATGNIGRRIVNHLIDMGANDIRALTTDPVKANMPAGVTPVVGPTTVGCMRSPARSR
jgi:uncharacterized protein YbjT (DUF2867 family)